MQKSLPTSVYMLSAGIFIMISCELQVLGMMDQLAKELHVSIARIGYLVSIFAASMAIGGPILALLVSKLETKTTIVALYSTFILGELLGASADSFTQLVIARAITGMVSGAFFGVSIGLSTRLVSAKNKLKAISTVLAGIMLGTIIGLPLAKLISESSNWQASFLLIAGLALLSAFITYITMPTLPSETPQPLAKELRAVLDKRLWWVFFTSFFIIGAIYAPFSYIVPILREVSGLNQNIITFILFAYGGMMLLGNYLITKVASKNAKKTLLIGIIIISVNLCTFALYGSYNWLAITCTLALGLCGVSLNPAMVSRLIELPQGERTFINTLHASMITLGIMFGSFIAGFALEKGFQLTAAIWIGVLIACCALLILLLSTELHRTNYPHAKQ